MSKQKQGDWAEIDALRQKIDDIDVEMVRLLNQRADLADRIGRIKRRLQIAVYAPGREEQVIANVQAKNTGPLSAGSHCPPVRTHH